MIVIALCFVVARWAIRPFREMADVVDRFGPTSIGLRLTNGANSTARDEQTRLSMSIDRVLDRLAEGYEAQRRFASNASHELRTPLATQRALIEVSLTSPLTPEQLDLVARQLLATNERNERLIDGLLTLAETERGLVSTAPVRLDRLVAATIETFTPATGEAGLRLEPHLEPTVVGGEAALLERLAANLIGNAVKYNRADGVIWVQVSMPGHLVVANTGPVVPAEAVGTLFEPFRRLSGERLEHGGGVGLGLTIVRSIVAAHHGSVRATANPDGGLRVEVQLPT
jgi:signal transduction histidine kinase